MCDFVLIDLYDQREAVMRFVTEREMDQDEILAWMRRYGRVKGYETQYGVRYSFTSVCGPWLPFHFHDGELVIFTHLGWL
jgi:hypothetical protein